jgi:hypothetical protein
MTDPVACLEVHRLWAHKAFYSGARPSFERLLTKLPNDTDIPDALVLISLKQGILPRDHWNRVAG